MASLLIKNAKIITEDTILVDYSVLCEQGKIVKIAPDAELNEVADEVIQAQGKYLAPGFIDLHFHGLKDYLIDNGPDDLDKICNTLPEFGVTSFAPTVCPLPKGKDAEFLASLATVKSKATNILAFHLEGPFLTLTGALPEDAIGDADPQRVEALINAAKPYKVVFSIAPDFEDIVKILPIMTQNNTPAFMTHTRANVEETQAAIAAGAAHATHFYDVFPCPEEIDPGVRPCGAVEAILADDNVSVDFILDGEHVDKVAVKMALKCKGKDKVCLITDANIGAGNPIGVYKFGNEEVEFKYPGGPARMTQNSSHPGGLAGSGLTMNLAVKNAVNKFDISLEQAIRMASTNPAKVMRVDNHKGKIEVGFDADIVMLDENLDVDATFVAAKCCYKKQ